VLCYDGSPESRRALSRAAELTRALEASLTVLSVADPLYRAQPYTGVADPEEEDAHRRLLEEATGQLGQLGIPATPVERTGSPDVVEAIVAVARETEADLIVVGHRHRGVLEHPWLGSVGGEVVVNAACDVLVVR
jgi:nucleotide-binding universal stress UspA family protein